MVISEDFQNGEMLFDELFDDYEDADEASEDSARGKVWLQHRVAAAQCDSKVVLQKSPLTRTVVMAVQRAIASLMSQQKVASLEQLGRQLAAKYGWPVVLRSGRAPKTGHQPPLNWFNKLRHSFLICSPLSGVDVIVDPSFRQMFEVGHPSRQYHAFSTSCIPEVFVGTRDMLSPLVVTAASAIAMSFSELGMPLPPWRHLNNLMQLWAPSSFADLPCAALVSTVATADGTCRGGVPLGSSVPAVRLGTSLSEAVTPLCSSARTSDPVVEGITAPINDEGSPVAAPEEKVITGVNRPSLVGAPQGVPTVFQQKAGAPAEVFSHTSLTLVFHKLSMGNSSTCGRSAEAACSSQQMVEIC